MALFAKLAESVGLFSLAEKQAAKRSLKFGAEEAFTKGFSAYRKAFGGVSRVTSESGIKVVTLGKRVPEFENIVTKRLDAFAMANPKAAERLAKVQILNPQDQAFDMNWIKRDSDFSSLLRRSDEGIAHHGELVASRAGNRRYPGEMGAGASPGDWIGLHVGTGLRRGETPWDSTLRNNDKIVIDLQALSQDWMKRSRMMSEHPFEAGVNQAFSVDARATSATNFFDRVMTHELGHVIHGVDADRKSLWSRFKLPEGLNDRFSISSQIKSRYANMNDSEAFAELYTSSVHEPENVGPALQGVLNDVRYGPEGKLTGDQREGLALARSRRAKQTPDRSLSRGMFGKRHSSARSGLAVRSSATGRFR